MKKICRLTVFLSLALIGMILIPGKNLINATNPLVMVDEFVVYPNAGGEEWIELLNPSQTAALDLTGWRMVIYQGTEPDYTYHYQQNLSGSVPRGGFLTFTTDNGTRLPNDGGCLVIFRDDTNSVYAVKYGNGVCDSGNEEQNATALSIERGKSIYYNLDENTWNSTSSATRGWCNPGSGSCPTINTIVSQMTGEDVATNLADQTDYSRISGLYFQKSQNGENIGKITFLSEMNFTDRDALTWMQSLDTKLNISQGIISLDADLIKNLTNTQASLTMYNIFLNNPKILVDNQDDNSGIVSGLTYDQTAHTLTFTAAHFTTFKAVENSTGSSSGSPGASGAPVCNSLPPSNDPLLFQIRTTGKTATVYFTPPRDTYDRFYLAYGTKPGVYPFGVEFTHEYYPYVIGYKINYLKPNTKYYFTLRAGNGCMPGIWSNVMTARTNGQTFHWVNQQ